MTPNDPEMGFNDSLGCVLDDRAIFKKSTISGENFFYVEKLWSEIFRAKMTEK